MDKEKADMLTQLVDPYNPGRIMYSTGKVIFNFIFINKLFLDC